MDKINSVKNPLVFMKKKIKMQKKLFTSTVQVHIISLPVQILYTVSSVTLPVKQAYRIALTVT